MKTLLINCSLIIIVLVSCSSPSSKSTNESPSESPSSKSTNESPSESPLSEESKIIGTPINIGNLEVAQNDFPKTMKWDDAIKACADLGSGWRLPTKDELNLMYRDKYKISRFANSSYWSSTEDEYDRRINGKELSWLQYFEDGYGHQDVYTKDNPANVRAVRSL